MQANSCVLCVTQDSALLDILRLALRSFAAEITTARSLREADKLVAATWPDIILLEARYAPHVHYSELGFLKYYQRRAGEEIADRLIRYERIPNSGPELAPVPEPLPPRRPRPLVAHAEAAIPEAPIDLDVRGRPLPDDDATGLLG